MTTTLDPRSTLVETAFDDRALLEDREHADAVLSVVDDLDTGRLRVAAPADDGTWTVHAWVQKAVSLYFAIAPMTASPIRNTVTMRALTPAGNSALTSVPGGRLTFIGR